MAVATQYSAIPVNAGRVQGWKTIPIKNGGEHDPLVPLGLLSQEAPGLLTSSVYFGEHSNSPYAMQENKLAGSLLTLFVRHSAARRLLVAEQLLPTGHHLLIFDAYRPYQVQKSLYDFYKQKLAEQYPGMSDAALDTETQKYVSLPSHDPMRPAPHNTGGAVDLAIIKLDAAHEAELLRIRSCLGGTLDFAQRVGLELRLSAIMRRHGRMLDFGTAFDHGGEASALSYYETKIAAGETLRAAEMRACNNRRLLHEVMTRVGFQPYCAEWWHFNAPESQMGAAAAGHKFASFGAMSLDENNKAHEHARLGARRTALRLQRQGSLNAQPTALHTEVLAAVRETGDPSIVGDWPTEIIAPSPTA